MNTNLPLQNYQEGQNPQGPTLREKQTSFVNKRNTSQVLLKNNNISSDSSKKDGHFMIYNYANAIISKSPEANPSTELKTKISSPSNAPSIYLENIAPLAIKEKGSFLSSEEDISSRDPGESTPRNILVKPKKEDGIKTQKSNKEEEEEAGISEEMIKKWNSQEGNRQQQAIAKEKIRQMRELGRKDAPSARIALSKLAGLKYHENKLYALNSLIEIISNDTHKKSSAYRLVEAAINLWDYIEAESFQQEDLETQKKLAEACNLIMEKLLIHYANKHINAITKTLKARIIKVTLAIKNLNTQEEKQIKYHLNCFLEGMRRFKDSEVKLYALLRRIYHLSVGAAKLYMSKGEKGFKHIHAAFKDLDVHKPNTWYDAIFILKQAKRSIKDDPEKLKLFLFQISKYHQKLDWKFSVAAIKELSDLALNGETPEIRMRALIGTKQLGPDYPGLSYFAKTPELKTYKNFGRIRNLDLPTNEDPNITIRKFGIEHLMQVIKKSRDEAIVKQAKQLLKDCTRIEQNPIVREIFEENG